MDVFVVDFTLGVKAMGSAKAIGFGLGVFVAFISPIYIPPVAQVLPSFLLSALPYSAALLAGLVLEHCAHSSQSKNSLVLGILISLFLGAANLAASFVGIGTDFPGLYYSVWVFCLSLPVSIFLVFVGTAIPTLWRKGLS